MRETRPGLRRIESDAELITKEKMLRYQEFQGDQDAWVRSQKKGLDETLTGAEWSLIDSIVQRLRLQKRLNPSVDYKNETERLLTVNLGDAEAIGIAREMV